MILIVYIINVKEIPNLVLRARRNSGGGLTFD